VHGSAGRARRRPRSRARRRPCCGRGRASRRPCAEQVDRSPAGRRPPAGCRSGRRRGRSRRAGRSRWRTAVDVAVQDLAEVGAADRGMRAPQVLDGELDGGERVLDLVRHLARHLAPGEDARRADLVGDVLEGGDRARAPRPAARAAAATAAARSAPPPPARWAASEAPSSRGSSVHRRARAPTSRGAVAREHARPAASCAPRISAARGLTSSIRPRRVEREHARWPPPPRSSPSAASRARGRRARDGCAAPSVVEGGVDAPELVPVGPRGAVRGDSPVPTVATAHGRARRAGGRARGRRGGRGRRRRPRPSRLIEQRDVREVAAACLRDLVGGERRAAPRGRRLGSSRR
jgi:hypothetical protein